MKDNYFLKPGVLLLAFTLISTLTIQAQKKFFDLNGGEPILTNFSVEFDVYLDNQPPWAEVYIVPPASDTLDEGTDIIEMKLMCIHFGHDAENLYKMKYYEGDGVYDIDGGYEPLFTVADYVYSAQVQYHFRVEMFPDSLKQNILMKQEGDSVYTVLANNIFWPIPNRRPGRLLEYTPGGIPINLENLVVDIDETGTGWHFDSYEDRGITCFPNPAVSDVKISFDGAISNVKFYSVSGAEIKNIAAGGKRELTVDVSDLQAGLYIMLTNTESGRYSNRLVKR
ncbi:MAG: T9SS type A sorting domain-containing protein [Bacteroidota bacterium]